MKPNNAVEDMWLRDQTKNQKVKRNTQRQDGDSIQAFSVLYMTQLEAVAQQ